MSEDGDETPDLPPDAPTMQEIDSIIDRLFPNRGSSNLSQTYNVMPGHRRNDMFYFDRFLSTQTGRAFISVVRTVANRVGIDPAFLAMNAITEHGMDIYISKNQVFSWQAGLDYWENLSRMVSRSSIQGTSELRARRTGRMFENEQGNQSPEYAFANGANVLLAMAIVLKFYENEIVQAAGSRLTTHARYALVRYAYNYSRRIAKQKAEQVARGLNPLPIRGAAGPRHPLRTATIRAVQTFTIQEGYFNR